MIACSGRGLSGLLCHRTFVSALACGYARLEVCVECVEGACAECDSVDRIMCVVWNYYALISCTSLFFISALFV